MSVRHSLRLRFALTFALVGAVLVLIHAVAILQLNRHQEAQLIDRIVSDEMEGLLQQYERIGSIDGPPYRPLQRFDVRADTQALSLRKWFRASWLVQAMGSVRVAAVDLGASSGRIIQVGFDGSHLGMDEIHRFPNVPVSVRSSLHWDVLRLWHEIQTGLRSIASDTRSIGVDSWGVDFALLDKNGQLLANPIHYRDSSSESGYAHLNEVMPRREIFERTGIQFMPTNGVNRMISLISSGSPLFDAADTMLTIADLFNYWLSGSRTCEFTMATTWQLCRSRPAVSGRRA